MLSSAGSSYPYTYWARVFRLGLCAMLLGVATAVHADPMGEPEDPMLQEIAVAHYVKKYRVDPGEAQYRLELQDRAGGIEDDVEALLGDQYAGVWFDHADRGRLKIGITRAAAPRTAELRTLAERYQVEGDFDSVEVRFTLNDLLRAQASARSALTSMISSARAKTGYDPSLNRVVVIALARLTADEESLIRRVQSMPEVNVRRLEIDSLAGRYHTCWVRQCDPPFRGGREIGELDAGSIYVCTAAFTAQDHVHPYRFHVITAGHCIHFGSWWNWASRDESGNWRLFGSSNYKAYFAGSSGRDAGRVRISNDSFWIPPNPAATVVVKASDDTTYNPNYKIRKTSLSNIGMTLCRTGRTTGTECGEVDLLGTDQTAWGTDGKIYSVSNMGELDVCDAEGGDSGGPIFKNHRAYGLFSGSVDVGPAFCWSWYQGIRAAEEFLDVSVQLAD